jgi:protein TonB
LGWKSSLLSLAVHAGAIAAVGVAVHQETRRAATSVTVRTYEHEAKKAEAKPPPPPPPKKDPKPARPKAAAPPSGAAPPPSSSRVLDLGLMISGDAPGGIGIEVAVAPPPPPKPKAPPPPTLVSSNGGREGRCREAPSKPVPQEKIRIEYPMAAREAGLEGRLVLRVHVDPHGEVVRVEVVESVGREIDEAAIDAVKRWRFLPAMACGKGVESDYLIARRFELGD